MRVASALLALALVAALPAPASASGFVMDGQLDAAYGVPRATQTLLTSHGDATTGLPVYSNGGELDGAWAVFDGDSLRLFFSGNFMCQGNPSDPGTFYHVLDVFLDTGSGGMTSIDTEAPGPLHGLNGFTFDAGFTPAWALLLRPHLQDAYQPASAGFLAGEFVELHPGGSHDVPLGLAPSPGPGVFDDNYGTGIRGTIDNRNTAGVGAGCGASSGAGATTGIELVVPLARIGSPTDCIRVSAVLTYESVESTNQVLPPLPDGLCPVYTANLRDFPSLAGDQYFTVCPGGTPVRRTTWGGLKSIYR